MGRSFSQPSAETALEDFAGKNSFYHQASETFYAMTLRDGAYYQRRHQLGWDGAETAVEEKRIDFIMGSGNHARTYLHRTPRGTLEELPLGWYAEGQDHWGMNPGYDRADHPGSRRAIPYECMFCHNGNPKIPAGHETLEAEPVFTGEMPLGIDCQRCHGPGARHIQVAQSRAASREQIRAAIVNPARLPPQRQLEVCLQCHLETTSFILPHSIARYANGPFSYRPGQPLGDFALFFDHAQGAGRDDKFEIAGAAYRLRKSQCFLKSNGALQCTTCHNPHAQPRGAAAQAQYNGACRKCHTVAFDRSVAAERHAAEPNCIGCHMPSRRTEDVVHVVMTDHFIQRSPPKEPGVRPLPERRETAADAYRGEVALYYPPTLAKTPENELYCAVAQVRQQNNLQPGLARLTALLRANPGARAEFYLEFADAWRDANQPLKAAEQYLEALRRKPDWVLALRKLAAAQEAAGQAEQAVASLQRAVQLSPADADAWHELGQVYLHQGRIADAVPTLQKALSLAPDIAEAHNSLGVVLAQGRDPRAETAFRNAIRISPEYVEARTNLASVLTGGAAVFELERAIRIQPGYAPARLGYGELLAAMGRLGDAEQQLQAAIQSEPNLAEAHLALADLLVRRGEIEGAASHLREAAKSDDPSTRALAESLLRKLGRQ